MLLPTPLSAGGSKPSSHDIVVVLESQFPRCLVSSFTRRRKTLQGTNNYTRIFLLCVKLMPFSPEKPTISGRNFTYLEDPGITYLNGKFGKTSTQKCLGIGEYLLVRRRVYSTKRPGVSFHLPWYLSRQHDNLALNLRSYYLIIGS